MTIDCGRTISTLAAGITELSIVVGGAVMTRRSRPGAGSRADGRAAPSAGLNTRTTGCIDFIGRASVVLTTGDGLGGAGRRSLQIRPSRVH